MTACKICGSTKAKRFPYKNQEQYPLFSGLSISVCGSCGYGEAMQVPSTDSLNDFYGFIFRDRNNPEFIDLIKGSTSYDLRSIAQIMLGSQYLRLRSDEKMRFLDIGAGVGHSFSTVRSFYPDAELYVMEKDERSKSYYKKAFEPITIVDDLSLVPDIDFMLMSHSLEHFAHKDATKILLRLAAVLSTEGVLVIEVPYADMRNIFYVNNRFSDAPHLSFFTIESLRGLLESCGFQLLYIGRAGETINRSYTTVANNVRLNSLDRSIGQSYLSSFIKIIKSAWPLSSLKKLRHNHRFFSEVVRSPDFRYGAEGSVIRCVFTKNTSNCQE